MTTIGQAFLTAIGVLGAILLIAIALLVAWEAYEWVTIAGRRLARTRAAWWARTHLARHRQRHG